MRASTPLRVLSLSLGLLLSLAACKDKLEDLPDVDPVDDPWVDQIEVEEMTAEVAVDPTAVPPTGVAAGTPAGTPEPTPTTGDPTLIAQADPTAAETPDPATAEAAKLGGATVPTSKPKSGPTNPSNNTPEPDAAVDPVAPTEPAPAHPSAPAGPNSPTPAVEPEPTPAAEPAKPAPPPPITMADYDGTFRFSGGSAQEQSLAEAIEFGANQVASIIRGVARKRLTKTQIIEDPVTITISGDSCKFHWGTTGEGMTCQIDGPTTTMSYKGDKYKARCRSKDGKMLITSFQAPDATKTIVYTLSSDRQTLTANHKLVADQLSEPVTFKLSYKRK